MRGDLFAMYLWIKSLSIFKYRKTRSLTPFTCFNYQSSNNDLYNQKWRNNNYSAIVTFSCCNYTVDILLQLNKRKNSTTVVLCYSVWLKGVFNNVTFTIYDQLCLLLWQHTCAFWTKKKEWIIYESYMQNRDHYYWPTLFFIIFLLVLSLCGGKEWTFLAIGHFCFWFFWLCVQHSC